MKIKNQHIIYIILFFSIFISACTDHIQVNTVPHVVKGVIDLRDWDFKKDGAVDLNGEWEFYWNKLLGPDDFQSKKIKTKIEYFIIPDIWKD